MVWWGPLVCPSSVQDRRAGQGVRLQLAVARAALDQGAHDNDPRTLHWVAYGEIEVRAGSAALQLLGRHDGTGARWRGLHRVDVEFEVGRAAPARATGLHPELGHLPPEGNVNGIVRVQDEIKHVDYVLGQTVSHAATVADQQLWSSTNVGAGDRRQSRRLHLQGQYTSRARPVPTKQPPMTSGRYWSIVSLDVGGRGAARNAPHPDVSRRAGQ